MIDHPRLRYVGNGRYEFVPAAKGEVAFRIVSDQGFVSEELSEEAAFDLAERFTRSKPGERFWPQSRIVGTTHWADCEVQR